MRPEQPRVQSDAADPCGDEAGILACCHVAVRTATAGEQELAGPFAGGPQIVIDRLAGLFAQFKSDGSPSFLLSDRCAIGRVSASGDILDPNGDDITAAKLAVDCQIEHSQIASAAFDLEFRPDRPDVLGAQRRLCPRDLALVPRHSLGRGGRIQLILHGHTPRLGYREREACATGLALEFGWFSDQSGLPVRLGGKRPVANDQMRISLYRSGYIYLLMRRNYFGRRNSQSGPGGLPDQ